MEFVGKKELTELVGNSEGNFFYVRPEDFPKFFDSFPEEIQETVYKIKESETGAVLAQGEKNFIVIPPFPIEKTFKGDKNFLLELMGKKFNLGIILLRLGEYSIGVFEKEELKAHKTGTQFVSGQTRAGGQSAARYARIREGQINDFFKAVCSQVREKFGPYKLDYVFFGGDSQTVKGFLKSCDYLKKFKVMKRTMNVRHMKLESLKNSLDEVWKFKVYEILCDSK